MLQKIMQSLSVVLLGASLWVAPRESLAQERGIHDPCLIREGDTYVLFSTGGRIPMRRSRDLVTWTLTGDSLQEIPAWAKTAVPETRGLWAPDISFFNDRYHLYYSVSTFGKNLSCIGLATNATLDPADPRYLWKDEGEVLGSRPGRDDFNAIDPNIVLDEKGQPWMSFGSFWSGIKLTRLDPQTGKPVGELTHIAGRGRGAIEAPFIVRHFEKYYLFVSFDFCCKGVDSNYKIMVGRADEVDGPYLDRDDQPLATGGGTLVLAGHHNVRGPGHNAVLSEAGRDLLVHHFYDADKRGRSALQIRPLLWSEDGWPLAGEPDLAAAIVPLPDLSGTWDYSVDYADREPLVLQSAGTVMGSSWRVSGRTLELELDDSSGVVTKTACHIGPLGTWFVGRNSNGQVIRGVKKP